MSDNPLTLVIAALDRLEAGQAAVTDRMTRLEAGQTALADKVERLETGQTALTDRMTRLETGQTALRVDLMARMDRLQTALDLQRQDIAVNFGATDRIREAGRHTRDEIDSLAALVAAMERQILMLSGRVAELENRQP